MFTKPPKPACLLSYLSPRARSLGSFRGPVGVRVKSSPRTEQRRRTERRVEGRTPPLRSRLVSARLLGYYWSCSSARRSARREPWRPSEHAPSVVREYIYTKAFPREPLVPFLPLARGRPVAPFRHLPLRYGPPAATVCSASSTPPLVTRPRTRASLLFCFSLSAFPSLALLCSALFVCLFVYLCNTWTEHA